MTKVSELNLNPWDRLKTPEPTALTTQVGGDHYKKLAIQPIEFIQKNGLGYIEGCIIKYICRYESKGQAEDLDKIVHYAKLLKEFKYGQ